MRAKVRCPAKINTFLAVGPPDLSGYHPIRSYFQAISLCDELHITPATQDEITSDWPDLPANNTISKTLRLSRELIEIPPLSIHLVKRIPSEAGLGGGSSDAAGLLRYLDRAYGPYPWGHQEMVAKAVGMDVAFFLVGGRAKAEGYGEILTPLEDLPPRWIAVIKPEVGVSTAEAYRQLDSAPREFREFPEDPFEIHNDFERVAPCACHEAIEHLLVRGATHAGLSGSGSAVFGFFDEEPTLPGAFTCQTLSREESLWMSFC